MPAGEQGTAWVASSLYEGGPLARAFGAAARLESGNVVALVPLSDRERSLGAPDVGGVMKGATPEVELESVVAELVQTGANVAIVEDDVGREDDTALSNDADIVSVGGGRVVHWLALPAKPPTTLQSFLRHSSTGYPTVCFIVRNEGVGGVHEAMDAVRRADADVLAVVVSAFDAETWMIWRSNHAR